MFVRFCLVLVCSFFVLPQVGHSENLPGACAVSIQLVSVECLPGDPNTSADDQFIVTTNVLGVEGAAGFVSPPFYPSLTPFATNIVFGPYPATEGAVTIVVADAENPDCTDEITVTPPEGCGEEECFINLVDVEYIIGDASYLIEVTIQGNGPFGWVADNNQDGDFGDRVQFGPFVCGEDPNLNIRDVEQPNACFAELLAPPNGCLDCFIEITDTSHVIIDGQFFLELTVMGTNASSDGWYSNINFEGPYNEPVLIGPLNCLLGITLFVADQEDNTCSDQIVVIPPTAACDPNCILVFNLIDYIIDTDSDSFSVVAFIDASNSTTWQSSEGQTGPTLEEVIIGPFACGEDVEVTFTDANGGNCEDIVTIPSPEECGNSNCSIELEDIFYTYNDDGTYLVTATVTGSGDVSQHWTSINLNSLVGEYNVPTTFGPFDCNQTVNFTLIDEVNEECFNDFTFIQTDECELAACNSLDLSASIQEITYDDGGTPNDPFDDTWYVIIIATANNNSGTYTTNFPGLVGTYGQPLTLGPILCETDPVSILIQDSTNPSCTVTLHPDIPSNCIPNNCALTVSQIEYLNCSNNGNDYCISFVVEDGGTGSPNGWITENGSSGQYGQPANLDVLCANTPSLLTIIDADDPNCIFTIELDPPANVCSNSCELTAQLESVVCSDDGQFYTATISFTGVEGDVFITQGGIFSSGEPFVIQGIPTFMSPTFTIRSLEDPFCEVDVAVQAPDCEGCSIGFELSDPIYDDGGTPANTADDTYTIDVIVLGEFGSGSWITPNGLTGQYGVSTPFIFSCADETPMIEVFDAEDETCSASIDLTGFFTCPDIDSCNALTLDILFEEVECNELAPISINISGLTPPYFFTIYDDADLTSIYSQDTFSTDTSYTIDLPEGYYVFSLTDENGCEHIIEFFHTPQPNFGVSLFYAADEECGTTGTIYYPGLGQPFSCSDGLQNGDETGVDCGGICAPCNFEGLIIDIQDNHGPIGTEVCLDVTARNFIDIASFQFGLSYYDFALDFTGFIPNSSLPGLNVTDSPGGNLVITWSSTDFEGVNLDDEEVLLSICFENTYGGASRIELSNFTTNQFFDSEENLLAFSSIPGIFYVADFDWMWILPNGEVVETNTISLPVDNQPGTYLLLMTDSNTGCVDTAEITLDPSLFLGCVSVTGTLWADEGSCALEGGEIPVPGWAVQIYSSDGNFVTYVITDENGNWSAELPPGDYFAEPSPFQPDLYASCDPAVGFTVANTIPHVDVLMPYVEECVIMYTHVSVGPLRVCEQQSVQVFYCNDGPVVAENAQIEVTFDELLSVEQVSIPPAQVFNQTYVFDLGDLAPFECGTIEFTIMVACDVELGQSQCVEVIASPNAPCPTPDGSWSGATVEVEVACDEEEGVSFRIENTGMGDMSVPLEYMVIEDVIMMMGNPVISDPLEDGEVIDIELPADGTSYIVWANQEPGSPGALMPIASIEGCGTDENGEFTTGVINQFATSPPDLDWYRLVCRPITGSFDPNAKVGYPLGYGDENLIEPGTRLTYDLYFQNTGNDFANRVVLVDSLAEELDLGTIRLGGSSHPYTYTIDENRVLTIIFDDIMLPDSTSDPIGSQGVVQFSIDHLPDLPLGTIIENEVDIYFDFNAPITTNRTHHKLDREFLPTDVEEPINDLPFWYVYPNPTANWLWIDFPLQYRELDRIEMIATDLLGREVLRAELLQGQVINLKVLPAATYLLRFQDDDGRVLGKAELIKH